MGKIAPGRGSKKKYDREAVFKKYCSYNGHINLYQLAEMFGISHSAASQAITEGFAKRKKFK